MSVDAKLGQVLHQAFGLVQRQELGYAHAHKRRLFLQRDSSLGHSALIDAHQCIDRCECIYRWSRHLNQEMCGCIGRKCSDTECVHNEVMHKKKCWDTGYL